MSDSRGCVCVYQYIWVVITWLIWVVVNPMVLYDQVGCVCEISRGPRVPDHFWGNYPRVITQGFWGSEKVGRSDR